MHWVDQRRVELLVDLLISVIELNRLRIGLDVAPIVLNDGDIPQIVEHSCRHPAHHRRTECSRVARLHGTHRDILHIRANVDGEIAARRRYR